MLGRRVICVQVHRWPDCSPFAEEQAGIRGGTKDFFPLKRDIHEPPYFLDSVLVVKPGASAGAGRYIPGTLWTNNKIVMNNIEKTTYS